ncbi:uncharacterized protein CLUP02_08407, partial [Colletotrichum lupini]
LKLTLKIKERGFEIEILYLFYCSLGRKYKILKGKLRYYKYIRYNRSYNITINTIYDYKFLSFFISIFYINYIYNKSSFI